MAAKRKAGQPYPATVRRRAVSLAKRWKSARRVGREMGIYYKTIHRWVRDGSGETRARPWRCPCDPIQTWYGTTCKLCGAAAPPML